MKILIFTASTGGGHKRAAAAFKDSVQRISPDTEIIIVDGLALAGKLYNDFICDGYTVIAKKAPHFYGLIYNNSNKKSKLNDLCNFANNSKGEFLVPTIEEHNPDAILSCHPFVTTMLGNLKTKGKISAPIFALITDFAPHYTYIAEGIDHYIVSSQEMVNVLTNKYGLSKDNVHSFGIPVFDKFAQPSDKEELRKKLGLNEKLPTVLFMAGSFGVNEVLKFYESIATKEPHLQFIVITGKNPRLYHRFEKIINSNTTLLMYVNNVNEYMHSADIIITKPGGLTISESLQSSLPMAIYSAFPGQEAENTVYLVKSGAAIVLDKNPGYAISTLLKDKNALKTMSENCKKICPKNPSQKLYDLICQVVNSNKNTKGEQIEN
jgi:processive 1,2-diacylglycerol beta-glucosyltransferase